MLRRRLFSLRARDAIGMMQDALIVQGTEIEEGFIGLLAMPEVSCLPVHHALPGCYSCRVDRA